MILSKTLVFIYILFIALLNCAKIQPKKEIAKSKSKFVFPSKTRTYDFTSQEWKEAMDYELMREFKDFIGLTRTLLLDLSKTESNLRTRGLSMLRGGYLTLSLYYYAAVHDGLTPFVLYYLLDSASVILLQIKNEDFDSGKLPELDFELGMISSCRKRAVEINAIFSSAALPEFMTKWVIRNQELKLRSLENLQNSTKFYRKMAVYLTNETDLFETFARVVEEHVGESGEIDLLKWFAGVDYCLENFIDSLTYLHSRRSCPDSINKELVILLAKMNTEFSNNLLTFQFINLSRLALFEKASKNTGQSYKTSLAADKIEFLEQNRFCYLSPTLESTIILFKITDGISEGLVDYWTENRDCKRRTQAMLLHTSLVYLQNILGVAVKNYRLYPDSTPLSTDLYIMISQLIPVANGALLKIVAGYLPTNLMNSVTPYLYRIGNEDKIEIRLFKLVYDLIEVEISKLYAEDPFMACFIYKFIEFNRNLVAIFDLNPTTKELKLTFNADLPVRIMTECLDYISAIAPENTDIFCTISLDSIALFINICLEVFGHLFVQMKIPACPDYSFYGYLLNRINENRTDKVIAQLAPYRGLLTELVGSQANILKMDKFNLFPQNENSSAPRNANLFDEAKTISAMINAKKSPYKPNVDTGAKKTVPAGSKVEDKRPNKVEKQAEMPVNQRKITKSTPMKESKRSRRRKNKEKKENEERKDRQNALSEHDVTSRFVEEFNGSGIEATEQSDNVKAETSFLISEKTVEAVDDAIVPIQNIIQPDREDMSIVPVKSLARCVRQTEEASPKAAKRIIEKNRRREELQIVPVKRAENDHLFNVKPRTILSGSKDLRDGMAFYWSKLAPILREEYKFMQMIEHHVQPKAITARTIEKYEEPSHHVALAMQAGLISLTIDPRDYLMGVVIVGQRIWNQVIQPLFTVIQRYEKELHWIQAFKESIGNFKYELTMLRELEPQLLQDRLDEAGLQFEVLLKYLDYYEKRNMVCHPLQFKSQKVQQNIASRHLTIFEHLELFDTDFINATRKELNAKDEIFVRGIETGLGRPKILLSPQYTEKALAVIGIHEMFSIDDIAIMRNGYSHKEVNDVTYQAYLQYVFKYSPDFELLAKLKK